jgi:hypothetical protein
LLIIIKKERPLMEKNISKSGIFTNTLLLIPFGGIVTAIIHAVAGNIF